MSRPTVPVHYLRANERNWTPRAVIFLDTETRPVQTGDTDVLGLRLWCATYLDRRPSRKITPRHVSGWGRTGGQLAAWIDDATRGREAVWAYAHNLGFDLTTTRLPLHLCARGWRVNDAAVGGRAPWIRLSKGRRTLTLLDSWSWLPVALDQVGAAVKVPKPPLPADEDSDAAWRARCGADVDILRAAITDLMDWFDRHRLGNWTITGAACGWNAYRHRESTSQVVVDPDPDKVARGRLYVHGGRRGTWSIGAHAAGPFLELDFAGAYPSIAAAMPHPIGRAWTFDSLPLDHPNLTSERWGVTARCLIDTPTARWPVRIGGATWYPVGRFWADLAGPDIAEAIRLGHLVEIGPGEVHRLGHNMGPWGQWVLRVMRGEEPDCPDVARLAAKSWSRAVIGKWASHSFERVKLGPSPNAGWAYEESFHHGLGAQGGMVDIAGQRWFVHDGGTPDNAYPEILAWIESEVRVRLGRVIDAIGPGAILQCDTDGMIVAQRVIGTRAAHGHLVAPDGLAGQARVQWVLNCLHPVTAPLDLRIKARVDHVTVLGPQHVKVDGQRRFAGMHRGLVEVEADTYRGKTWPTFQWQLTHGDPRGYVRPTVTSHITGPFPTGWILADKRVVPVETTVDENGRTAITPWHLTGYALQGWHRADTQHPTLDALI